MVYCVALEFEFQSIRGVFGFHSGQKLFLFKHPARLKKTVTVAKKSKLFLPPNAP
jgi:hypothetical protein